MVQIYFSEKKDGSMFLPKNINKFLDKNNIEKEKLIKPKLVHGKDVAVIKDDLFLSKTFLSDGLITKRKDLFLAVTVSDCLPIYFYSKNYIGIIHCGWKSLYKGVIEEMISRILEMEEDLKDTKVLIGPHIKDCHFQIKDDLKKHFKDFKDCFREYDKKRYLDLGKVVKIKLRNNGINNIKISKRCTFCDKNLFSFRRDKKINQMLAVIGFKNS